MWDESRVARRSASCPHRLHQVASDPRAELLKLETDIDQTVRNLPILRLPVRAIVASLHLLADRLLNGSDDEARLRGVAAVSRLAYVAPLLAQAPTEPFGGSAHNALLAYLETDPEGTQSQLLWTYGHFSELMPEIHRGYYEVSGSRDSGFGLSHAQHRGEYEVRDIILSDLAGAYGWVVPDERIDPKFDAIARNAPVLPPEARRLAESLRDLYQRTLLERPPISDVGLRSAVGVDYAEFRRFRAACWAIADLCRGVARSLRRRWSIHPTDEALFGEYLEWVSVNWREDFLLGFISELARLDAVKVGRLLDVFSIDLRSGDASHVHVGDGFMPPFVRLGKSYLFNGDLIRSAILVRNVLYAINRSKKDDFDQLVSVHMEPQLIDDAIEIVRAVPNLEIARNCKWEHGELDLIIYSPAENVAIHVQAKAAIPPQGARMVAANESRIREGLSQLERFREQSVETREDALGRALGHSVKGVQVSDMVLSRTCFGTERIWQEAGSVALINLELLSVVLGSTDPDRPIGDLRGRAARYLTELAIATSPQWVHVELNMGLARLRIPMLRYDSGVIPRRKPDV